VLGRHRMFLGDGHRHRTAGLPVARLSKSFQFHPIADANQATLCITNAQPTTHRFRVVVSNAEGAVTSRLAKLTVVMPPTITNQPISQIGWIGNMAAFRVAATGIARYSTSGASRILT